ncbi:MAG TPA: hypothetical protein VN671_10695 [Solirubrobacterales bacterium]|nr:hypothetical protein [Solirubrobacterales bacterium]
MPYADIAAFVFLLLSGALALAHSDEWPSGNAWSKGHPLLLAQLLVFVLLGLTQLAILIAGRRGERNEGREKACQLVAAYVDEHCPQVQLRHVGVHLWTVAGPPFARYLKRSASFLLAGDRERSGIVWVKGKGVVGATWEEGRPITRDIDAIREKAVSRETYEALGHQDTMDLSWDEFGRTPHYRAISGVPLYRRAGAGSAVCGVVAIDFLESGHFRELEKAVEDPAFAYVIGVCESNA